MNQQQGFSLIEVLLSLMLATTLALALIQQQWNTRLLINRLLFRSGATLFLDQINELLYVGADKLPPAPAPYHLDIQRTHDDYAVRLDWFNQSDSMTRKYNQIRQL